MVGSFDWASSPKIFFGQGKRKELAKLAIRFGKRILILTGGRSFVESPYWPELQESLETAKLHWQQYAISQEPSPQLIDDCVSVFRDWMPDAVLAIGGGSVLDAGKAIAAMLTEKKGVKNYLEGVGNESPSGSSLPFIALPTTSGTGSEATKNAVLSEIGPNGFKKSLRHDAYVPLIALLDPELTISAPAQVSARSGMDAFTQLLEAYLSVKASPISDALALEGLRLIRDCLLPVCKDGENLRAREGMSYAALLSGLCLANSGLGLVHGFASSVGGRIEIPHGLLCGKLMGPVNRISLQALRQRKTWTEALLKYKKAGKLFHPERNYKPDNWYADALIETIESWSDQLGLENLGGFGLQKEDVPQIVARTAQKNHPVTLHEEEVSQILISVIN